MSANLRAFLYLIRWCEGTSGENGYRTLFGGGMFDSFADHPRKAITRPLGGKNLTSTAAGAYQFLTRTWDECQKALNLPDFSPESQDRAAVFLIKRRGALPDVEAGRLESAIRKCNREWASLPGSPYGQPIKTFEECRRTYLKAGGEIVEEIITPQEAPVAPFIAAALPALVKAIPDLWATLKDRDKESSDQYVKAGEKLANIAVEATQAANLQEATERIQNDPQMAAAFREATKAKWYEIAGASEETIATARKFALEKRDIGFVDWLAVGFVAIASAGAGYVLWDSQFSMELKGAVVTMIIIGGFNGIKEFYYGSSKSSERKTELLGGR